jgi:hypothetical protein
MKIDTSAHWSPGFYYWFIPIHTVQRVVTERPGILTLFLCSKFSSAYKIESKSLRLPPEVHVLALPLACSLSTCHLLPSPPRNTTECSLHFWPCTHACTLSSGKHPPDYQAIHSLSYAPCQRGQRPQANLSSWYFSFALRITKCHRLAKFQGRKIEFNYSNEILRRD